MQCFRGGLRRAGLALSEDAGPTAVIRALCSTDHATAAALGAAALAIGRAAASLLTRLAAFAEAGGPETCCLREDLQGVLQAMLKPPLFPSIFFPDFKR